MISEGSINKDSNRVRKAWSMSESLGVNLFTRDDGPIISFGYKDMESVHVFHNDALVVQEKVANYEIQRVFVDSGSLINVIFQKAFDQMDFQGYRLELVDTALLGFVCHTIYLKGETILPLTMGNREN